MSIKCLAFICALLLTIQSCQNTTVSANSFKGDTKAVEMADNMFDAIGGKQAWCSLKSLYIKAKHTEPQMTLPYQSEIWRNITDFDLIIEQQNDSFHVRAVMNDSSGIVNYLDQRDTFRVLNDEQLNNWKFSNKHNVYVLFHDLACSPSEYTAVVEKDHLAFYRDSIFITRFGLDDQLRPYLFYAPNPDGTVSGSIFNRLGTDKGLVHSDGGHPLDSNFMYVTELWEPVFDDK